MKGVYLQKNSPYYWIRYYDKYEQNDSRKRKSINTKIQVTESDWKRYKESQQLSGTSELRNKLKSFRDGLNNRNIEIQSGVKLRHDKTLLDGYEEFKQFRSVPGSKKEVKLKTLENYKLAVDHFVSCSGNKLIYKYTDKDYVALLNFFEGKNLSRNSRSIYTRALKTLWAYFVQKVYTLKNIIEPVEAETKDPDPIPLDDMFTIVEYFKADTDYPHHYFIVYFMLLTGCRPSSAIMQAKEDIDFKRKVITIKNVKSGRRKGKEFYKFPLYKELEQLLRLMKADKGAGRLFSMYSVVPEHYTWPLSFWKRGMASLVKGKKISKAYSLKQIRPTLASYLINKLKMDIYTVKKLLDHSDVKITDNHYIDFRVDNVRKELDEIELNNFIK
jgi:integrase/recombinase XerD